MVFSSNPQFRESFPLLCSRDKDSVAVAVLIDPLYSQPAVILQLCPRVVLSRLSLLACGAVPLQLAGGLVTYTQQGQTITYKETCLRQPM